MPLFAFPARGRREGASGQLLVCGDGSTQLAAVKERARLWWLDEGLPLLPRGTGTCPCLRPPFIPLPRYSFPAPEGPGFLGNLTHRILHSIQILVP